MAPPTRVRPTRVRRDDDGTVTPVNTRAGSVDPATGGRWQGGGRPTHTDGTPMTQAEIDAETADDGGDAPAEVRPRRPRDRADVRARRAPAGPKAPPKGPAKGGRRRVSWSPSALGGRALAPLRGETDATGFVLALLLWGWVVLPMLQGGPDAVRDVARAKFTNRGPDGEWLP